MEKFMLISNVFFAIASVILLLSLLYISVTKGFTIVTITSMIVVLFIGIHSIVDILKREG